MQKGARDVIAIERQPMKLKADRFIRSVPDAKIQRLRVDIEVSDLDSIAFCSCMYMCL